MALNNKNDVDEDGLGFNPIKFARDIFDAIEPYRSRMGPKENEVITSPASEGMAGISTESRLNTFLRLLGFPATRDESLLNKAITDEDIRNAKRIRTANAFSQDNTLNYIPNLLNIDNKITAFAFRARQSFSTEAVTGEQFNRLLEDPLEFNASINGTTRRTSLFPLAVDATIPIYPMVRRVAPFFNNGDATIAGERLSRPFIEHIIYIRAKDLNSDEVVINDLKQSIDDVLPDSLLVENVLNSLNPSAVELYITRKFIQTIKRLVIDYQAAVNNAKKAIAEIKFLPSFVAYPDERSKTDISSGGDVTGYPLDEKIQSLERALREKESMVFLLPTEFINRSDRDRRTGGEVEIHNFKDDIFMSNFTDLITYEAESIRNDLNIAKGERQRKVQIIEKAKRDLMYFTGEFTGLSIFDVVCVLYGLFTVDLKYVVSLLNKDALARFIADPYFATTTTNGTIRVFKSLSDILPGDVLNDPSTENALVEVQKKVEEAFAMAELFQADIKSPRQRG